MKSLNLSTQRFNWWKSLDKLLQGTGRSSYPLLSRSWIFLQSRLKCSTNRRQSTWSSRQTSFTLSKRALPSSNFFFQILPAQIVSFLFLDLIFIQNYFLEILFLESGMIRQLAAKWPKATQIMISASIAASSDATVQIITGTRRIIFIVAELFQHCCRLSLVFLTPEAHRIHLRSIKVIIQSRFLTILGHFDFSPFTFSSPVR